MGAGLRAEAALNQRLSASDWDEAIRAVASAARKSPGYLVVTLHEAANRVAYYMK
jgi:hypothetical protein